MKKIKAVVVLDETVEDLEDGRDFYESYDIDLNIARVAAVLDMRRDPAWIRKELKDRPL